MSSAQRSRIALHRPRMGCLATQVPPTFFFPGEIDSHLAGPNNQPTSLVLFQTNTNHVRKTNSPLS